MKITLTEQELKNTVRKGIMEVVDAEAIARGTSLHFSKKSETARRLKKMEDYTGWGIQAIKPEEGFYKFIMGPSREGRVMSREEYIETITDAIPAMVNVEPYGESLVMLTIDTNKSFDYKNSMKYATDKWNSNASWKTEWGLDDPAGVPGQ